MTYTLCVFHQVTYVSLYELRARTLVVPHGLMIALRSQLFTWWTQIQIFHEQVLPAGVIPCHTDSD